MPDLSEGPEENLDQLVSHILPQFIDLNSDVVKELREFSVRGKLAFILHQCLS